jgi:hypothetical protein
MKVPICKIHIAAPNSKQHRPKTPSKFCQKMLTVHIHSCLEQNLPQLFKTKVNMVSEIYAEALNLCFIR